MKVLDKESQSHFPSLTWVQRFLWEEEKPAKEEAPGIPKSTGFSVSAFKLHVGHPRQLKTKGRASEVGRRDQPWTKGHICLIQLEVQSRRPLEALGKEELVLVFVFFPTGAAGVFQQTLAIGMGLVVRKRNWHQGSDAKGGPSM